MSFQGKLLKFISTMDKMIKTIAIILVSINSVVGQSANIEKIEFVSNGITLVGFLNKPKNTSPFPLVVVLHSARFGSHDTPIYNHLAKTLNEIGVGVFVYDRRGSGESGGNFENASLEDLAIDGANAIAYLKKRSDIDKSKIGLFGVSQGGWVAPITYSLAKKDIAYMILVSSCGATPAEQMDYTASTTLQRNGFANHDIKKALEARSVINNYYRGNISYDSTEKIISKYRKENWFKLSWLPLNKDLKLPAEPTKTKWFLEMDFSPSTYFKNIKIPLMLCYGSNDIYVPINLSISIWKKALKEAGNSDYKIFRVKQSGHLMIVDEDNNPNNQIISGLYTQYLKSWVFSIINN